MGYVIEESLKETIEGFLESGPVDEVAKSVATVLDAVGLATSVAAELMGILAAKYGINTVEELKAYLTSDAAKAARTQADALEAAELAELAGSKT